MRSRVLTGFMVVGVVALAGGASYWFYERNRAPHGAMAAEAESGASDSSHLGDAEHPASDTLQPSPYEKKEPPATSDSDTPWRTGEVLDYSADVAKLTNVANLRLQVAGRPDFEGKKAWHLQAFAHTESPLRIVFELDDQFDSYSDVATLASLQYEMHLKERGEKIDSVQRMTTGKGPAPANATKTQVLPGTRDPLGLMQYLRSVDWQKTREVHGPVYDGHKLYDVRASLTSSADAVVVPAGNYRASKIEIRVFDQGVEMKDASFALYLANNASRTPVLLEAVMPFATARVQLVKAK
jgi:Protein of unknown function (DUF3108)